MRSIENPKEFRSNIRNKIEKILLDNTKSINLEIGIYNYALKEATSQKILKKWDNVYFVQLYLDRLRSIYINLKNDKLLNQIKKNEITVQTLAFMTHQEMDSDLWKDLIEQKVVLIRINYLTQ